MDCPWTVHGLLNEKPRTVGVQSYLFLTGRVFLAHLFCFISAIGLCIVETVFFISRNPGFLSSDWVLFILALGFTFRTRWTRVLGVACGSWPWTVHGHGKSMAMDRPWPWTDHGHGPAWPGPAQKARRLLYKLTTPCTIQAYDTVYYTSLPRQYYTSLPRRYYTSLPRRYYTSLPRQYYTSLPRQHSGCPPRRLLT